MTSLRKRILVLSSATIILFFIAILFVIRNANEILKNELEKSIGKDFHVDRIVLNWGSVDAYGIRLSREGREMARAGSMSIRADFLSFLKGKNEISSVSIEKPIISVLIDKAGSLNLPLPNPKKDGTTGIISFKVGRVNIYDGTITIVDERLPEGRNNAVIGDMNFRLSNLSYPFGDTVSSFILSAGSEGRIISGRINAEGRAGLNNGYLDVRLKGEKIALLDLDEKGPLFRSELLQMSVQTKDDRKGRYYFVDNVVLKRPYLRYETDDAGDLASPWKEVMDEMGRVIEAGRKKS